MIKKGSMRLPKKILGVIFIIVGLANLFNYIPLMTFIDTYRIIFGITLGFAGYLLYISGRQR